MDIPLMNQQPAPPPNINSQRPLDEVSLEKYLTRIITDHMNAASVASVASEVLRVSELSSLREQMIAAIAFEREMNRSHFEASAMAIEKASLANEKRFDAMNASSSLAIDKASVANDKRFDAVNEFRATLTDSNNKFAIREVIDAQFEAMRKANEADRRANEEAKNADRTLVSDNKQEISNVRTQIITAGGAVTVFLTLVQIALHFLK